jgi:DNA-binding MarR family transcriptional regulator
MAEDLTQEIVQLYMQLDDVLVEGLKEQTAAGGLTMVQYVTLEFLTEHGPCSSKALSDFLDITPPSTSALAKKLEGCGFVSRQPATDDRRVVRLSITAAGERARRTALFGLGKRLGRLLVHLSDEDLEHLRCILQKLLTGASDADSPED